LIAVALASFPSTAAVAPAVVLALWKSARFVPDAASYVKTGSGMAGPLHVLFQKADLSANRAR
jgi:hypothetical protein